MWLRLCWWWRRRARLLRSAVPQARPPLRLAAALAVRDRRRAVLAVYIDQAVTVVLVEGRGVRSLA